MAGEAAWVCGTCAICLNSISPADETFVDPCFHHFCYKCIKTWLAEQASQTADGRHCPLCRQPCLALITDCHEFSFRLEEIGPTGTHHKVVQPASARPGAVHLTVQHRRRRAVYFNAPQDVPAGAGGMPAPGRSECRIKPANLVRQGLREWTTRELQALLLEQDVSLLTHLVMGVLSAAGQTPSARSAVEGPSLEAVTSGVRAAVSPFLPKPHAARFADELAAFVASGMSVAGHDARVAVLEAGVDVVGGLNGGSRFGRGVQTHSLANELDDSSAWDRV